MDALLRHDPRLALAVVDGLVVLFALEAIVIVRWLRHRAALPGVLANLAAGAALVLSLRAALAQSPLLQLAGWLALAGLCHAMGLWHTARQIRGGGAHHVPPPREEVPRPGPPV